MSSTGNSVSTGRRGRRQAGAPFGLLTLAYSAFAYVCFLAVLIYTAGFIAGLGVPKNISTGPHSPWPLATAIDLALLGLFAVQHSAMARPWFKGWLTRLVPPAAERSTYVLASSVALALLYWLWRPVGGEVWRTAGLARVVLLACYGVGWAVAVGSTFLIDHGDLFGLRQGWLAARGAEYRPPAFTERSLYRYVRHPLMAGFVILLWSAPVMTGSRLLFAAAATGYIGVGIKFEEHDLQQAIGEPYAAYQARVPAICPIPRRRSS